MFWDFLLSYWPPIVYSTIACAVAFIPHLIAWLRPQTQYYYDHQSLDAYECGFEPLEDSRMPFHISFYCVAISFVLFDLEMLFLFPWAQSLNKQISFDVFISGIIFILLLLVGLYYEYRRGIFAWSKMKNKT